MVVVVEPIVLPPSLISIGYSSNVFTDKMISESQRLLSTSRGSDSKLPHTMATLAPECITISPFTEDLKRDYVKAFPYVTRIQAKREKEKMFYDKLADSIAFYLDEYIPWYSWKTVEVRGEVQQDGGLYRLTLTGTFPSGSAYRSQTILSGDPSHYAETSGLSLLKYAAPWTYVATTAFRDLDQSSDAIDMILTEFNEHDQSLGLSMKGYSLLYAGKWTRKPRDLRSAEEIFNEALKLSPGNYWALVGDAETSLNIYQPMVRRPKTAIEMSALFKAEVDLRSAIEIEPDNPRAYGIMSHLHWFTGDMEKSENYRTQFLNRAKKRGEYFRASVGWIDIKLSSPALRDQHEAEKEFKELTRTLASEASEHSALQFFRGILAARKGDWDVIRTVTGELLRSKNWCLIETLAAGIAHESKNLTGSEAQQRFLLEADFLFSQAREGGMNNFNSNHIWGEVLVVLEKYDQAIEKFKKALEHFGDHVLALLRWGEALMGQNKFNEAETKFRQSMSVEPTADALEGLLLSIFNQGVNNKEARMHQSRKLIEEVEIYERKWSKLVPIVNPNVLYAISASYCSLGNYDQTIKYRSKIPKADKNSLLLEDLETCLKSQPISK
jgi:tetratricopeptide (TPR) repeat protein